ncbi:hypothetical protein JCM19037_4593 [Geomicrobium sp. JCM 19037]|uniref:hypothetical protein n=1 Tax=Geomicrobium sp. JCM 19037 TaxID=1460634 RepID=UPI00045F4827|nr:hypothetical protein [Geomicrobium sp. JCM 19037]GAK06039.1 hypothetical protein JCM19037_4593 [Geomicrobium sp. JCM 19037]
MQTPKLRDYFKPDFGTFIDTDEFGVSVKIDGEITTVVIDEDTYSERNQGNDTEGLSTKGLIFYVSEDDYPYHIKIGQSMTFDGSMYEVSDVQLNEGMYTVTLEVPR